jgi:hypothetical protein
MQHGQLTLSSQFGPKFSIRTSAELNRVATKAATTTMETTILIVVETAVILNVVSSF